jgi:epoxyqueuosine reductase
LPGIVARYARRRDYHRVLRRRLRRLAGDIETIAGRSIRYRVCVDTAPLLERDLAARAGIGWIGKHTGLLDTHLGNWFVIGTLLTDLDLDADPPARSRCGRCRACLDACPTGALREPYRLDARRCISYHTIENRGAIPRGLRSRMGSWVFGCDACLAACPWNRFAPATQADAWQHDPERSRVDIVAWLADDGSRLERAMRGSALRRAGRDGLLRNAAVVAGNVRLERAVPALGNLCARNPSPLVRAHAAWALGRMPGPQATRALRETLARETDTDVVDEIRGALEA